MQGEGLALTRHDVKWSEAAKLIGLTRYAQKMLYVSVWRRTLPILNRSNNGPVEGLPDVKKMR